MIRNAGRPKAPVGARWGHLEDDLARNDELREGNRAQREFIKAALANDGVIDAIEAGQLLHMETIEAARLRAWHRDVREEAVDNSYPFLLESGPEEAA